MKRYHYRKNPNGTYGRCSQRTLADFKLGERVVITVSIYPWKVGSEWVVRAIGTKILHLEEYGYYNYNDGLDTWPCSEPHTLEHRNHWIANVE